MAPTEKKEWPILGMTVDEAAASLRVNTRTILDLLRDGAIPGRKVGKSWRISPAAIERWLDHFGADGEND